MSPDAPVTDHAAPAGATAPAHHFADLGQQKESLLLGMWTFLLTELMIFGGLFTAYTVYRYSYPVAFAEASGHLSWVIASINTVVLITSSFTMALAVYGAQAGTRRILVGGLIATVALGLAFLGLKAGEYVMDFKDGLVPIEGHFKSDLWHGWHEEQKKEPEGKGQVSEKKALTSQEVRDAEEEREAVHREQVQRYLGQVKLFLTMYYIMTGLHALHMIAGLAILGVMIFRARRGAYTPEYHPGVEMMGLYWHFVDVVWIFLLPLLYLSGAHH